MLLFVMCDAYILNNLERASPNNGSYYRSRLPVITSMKWIIKPLVTKFNRLKADYLEERALECAISVTCTHVREHFLCDVVELH